ncbi:hypothetical protein SAMN05444156_1300 [Verrucomicrobium sp. GAS474]|uniref:hypothetical protein n=1 Tax=Verrucomicrobium sp. GAS474 TaxID=1882831 RepID=UPI00087C7816|nr:hypothetical protein [Verrucomicrobium sp. GAS474]SDT99166.1 hypothetical protein SAMN05444156_1300 [Verrucomicrobium sp. GAS474]
MKKPSPRKAKPTQPRVRKQARPASLPVPLAPAGDVLLRERINALATILDETSRRFLSRLRREIEETEEGLHRQSVKKQEKAIRLIDALQVKPAKGRRKDLKKIDLLIGELQKLTEEK